MTVHLRFTIQSYVDAAYAEMGIRNRLNGSKNYVIVWPE